MKKTLLLLLLLFTASSVWAYQTPAPEVHFELTDDHVVITAIGEGEVLLYVNYELVENPYTYIRGEKDEEIYVYATAQRDNEAQIGFYQDIFTVPAREIGPDDPHMMGYWLVLIDRHGEEVWVKLRQTDNGSWSYPVVLDYATYGGYRPGIDPVRQVPYYFVVDGVSWGAPEDGMATVLGNSMNNPLFEGNNNYTVPVGYNYTLGIYPGWDDMYYAYSAQGGRVSGNPADYADVDETVRGDADGDGVVTIADAVMLIDYIISHDATDINLDNADSDQDGEISIADVVATIDFILTQTW